MALPVNWSHRYAHLKAQGRTVTHRRDPPDEEEEPEKVRGLRGQSTRATVWGPVACKHTFCEVSNKVARRMHGA